MVLVNTDYISGKTLETISLVSGSSESVMPVNDVNMSRAVTQMVELAGRLEADGIVNIKYSLTDYYAFVAGTAVKFV